MLQANASNLLRERRVRTVCVHICSEQYTLRLYYIHCYRLLPRFLRHSAFPASTLLNSLQLPHTSLARTSEAVVTQLLLHSAHIHSKTQGSESQHQGNDAICVLQDPRKRGKIPIQPRSLKPEVLFTP